jgi:hypothetical protein
MTKPEIEYIIALEHLIKQIPDIYYQGAMDKEWGYSEDELEEEQEKYEEQVDKTLSYKPSTYEESIKQHTNDNTIKG